MTDLKGLFRYATEHEPPPFAGPAAVFERAGAIRRRRQRVVAALAGVAVAGVLIAGFAVSRPGPAVPPAAPAITSPAGEVRIGATRVMNELRRLLNPETRLASEVSRPGLARVVVVDPDGRTTLEVTVEAARQPITWYDCANHVESPAFRCTSAVLDDRTRLVALDQPGFNGVHVREVDTLSPTGLRVRVSAWNAVDTRHGPLTRPVPVYDMADLRSLATAEVWRSVAAGN